MILDWENYICASATSAPCQLFCIDFFAEKYVQVCNKINRMCNLPPISIKLIFAMNLPKIVRYLHKAAFHNLRTTQN